VIETITSETPATAGQDRAGSAVDMREYRKVRWFSALPPVSPGTPFETSAWSRSDAKRPLLGCGVSTCRPRDPESFYGYNFVPGNYALLL